MTKIGLEFGILVIVICLIFGICDLEFLFLLLPGHGVIIPKNKKGAEVAVHQRQFRFVSLAFLPYLFTFLYS